MSSRLQDVLLRGTAAARPLATAVAIGTLYYSTDTQVTDQSDGTNWNSYSDTGGGGSYAALIHATTHSSGGSDPVDVTNLDGFPGGTTDFLRADGTFAAPSGATVRKQLTFTIQDAGGGVITTGIKQMYTLPVSGTWKKWRILSIDSAGPATAGSAVFDLWQDTYANFPPTVADTITAAAKPTVSAANKAESSTLTGWTTAFTAGDTLVINLDSCSTFTKLLLALEYE